MKMIITEKNKIRLYRLGIIMFFLGTLDPMEGSLLIAPASMMIGIGSYLLQKKYWKFYVIDAVLIAVGVFFLWFLSSLGGFGGNSKLSIWWGLTLIPYPLGWLLNVILLCISYFRRKN